MKVLSIFLLLFLLSGAVYGTDQTVLEPEKTKSDKTPPVEDSKKVKKQVKDGVADLMGMPAKGNLWGAFVYGKFQTSSSVEVDTNLVFASLEYGLSDDLVLAGGFGYSVTTVSFFNFTSKGVTLPRFGLRYRLNEPEEKALDWEISLEIAPKLGAAKTATTNVDGNAFRSRTSVEATLSTGRKVDKMDWSSGVNLATFFSGETESAADSSSISEVQSETKMALFYNYQHRWSDRWQTAFSAFLDYPIVPTGSSTFSFFDNLDFSATLGQRYHIIPDTFTLLFFAGFNRLSPYTSSSSLESTAKSFGLSVARAF